MKVENEDQKRCKDNTQDTIGDILLELAQHRASTKIWIVEKIKDRKRDQHVDLHHHHHDLVASRSNRSVIVPLIGFSRRRRCAHRRQLRIRGWPRSPRSRRVLRSLVTLLSFRASSGNPITDAYVPTNPCHFLWIFIFNAINPFR